MTPFPVHEPVTVSGNVKPPPPGPPPLAGALSPTGTRKPSQRLVSSTVVLRVAVPRFLPTTKSEAGITKQPEGSKNGGWGGSGIGKEMGTGRNVYSFQAPFPLGVTG